MENMLTPDNTYPFEDVTLKTPKAIQGGTYSSKLNLEGNPIIVQTPKCVTKNGIHTTIKQMYCDILMNKNHEEFIEWLRKFQERVREIILNNADNWFHTTPSLDEIEYNWNDSIRIYKKSNYLVRTFVHKNKNINTPSLQIYNANEEELSLEDITADKSVICILEITGLKFSSQSFQLEICLRQIMVINEKPLFGKCLIKLNSNQTKAETATVINKKEGETSTDIKQLSENEESVSKDICEEDSEITNSENYTTNGKEISDNPNIEQDIDDPIENFQNDITATSDIVEMAKDEDEPTEVKKIQDICSNSIIENKSANDTEESLENTDTDLQNRKVEKSIKCSKHLESNSLEEIDLEIENPAEPIVLKNPSEVYLDIYRMARQKAKEAKNAAIKAYLDAKRIKELYMLDVADSSDEEEYSTDEESNII